MTDEQIIAGLLSRDNRITHDFFYVKCRPLLTAILRLVFNHTVDYDEMASELYRYLMEEDGAKLRNFQYRSTLYQWMKVVATRFFIRIRDQIIKDASHEPTLEREATSEVVDTAETVDNRIDVEKLLQLMANRRYAETIRCLVLQDMEPEEYAAQIGVTVDNLYNIKKRAMSALTRIALKHYGYERKTS